MSCCSAPASGGIRLARVLLVDDDPTSRHALELLLQLGGYEVDTAASAAEAIHRMEQSEYELVLTDLGMESPEAGLRVLAHARHLPYKPATAVIRTYREPGQAGETGSPEDDEQVAIAAEDVPELLDKVAELISERARKRLARTLRR